MQLKETFVLTLRINKDERIDQVAILGSKDLFDEIMSPRGNKKMRGGG